MTYPHREAQFKAQLRAALEQAGEVFDEDLFAASAKQISVILPAEIDALACSHRGWYTASGLYEAVYKQPIPSQGLAVRLGHHLRAMAPFCKVVGPQRYYWIAPAGVRPPEQIGVS